MEVGELPGTWFPPSPAPGATGRLGDSSDPALPQGGERFAGFPSAGNNSVECFYNDPALG